MTLALTSLQCRASLQCVRSSSSSFLAAISILFIYLCCARRMHACARARLSSSSFRSARDSTRRNFTVTCCLRARASQRTLHLINQVNEAATRRDAMERLNSIERAIIISVCVCASINLNARVVSARCGQCVQRTALWVPQKSASHSHGRSSQIQSHQNQINDFVECNLCVCARARDSCDASVRLAHTRKQLERCERRSNANRCAHARTHTRTAHRMRNSFTIKHTHRDKCNGSRSSLCESANASSRDCHLCERANIKLFARMTRRSWLNLRSIFVCEDANGPPGALAAEIGSRM